MADDSKKLEKRFVELGESLASPPSSVDELYSLVDVAVCQKCGDIGFKELLLYCRKCRTSAEHKYCLDQFPKNNEKVRWFCEQCKPRAPVTPLEKIVVKSGRSTDDLKFKDQQFNSSDSIEKPREKILKISNRGKTVALLKLHNDVASHSQQQMIEGESSPHKSTEYGEGRISKKQRRMIFANEHHLDKQLQSDCGKKNVINKCTEIPTEPLLAMLPPDAASCGEVTIGSKMVAREKSLVEQAVVPYGQVHVNHVGAQPIVDHVWRGCMSFGGEEYGPLTAHVSSLACDRVFDAAKLLPSVLHMEKLSRLDSLPNSFKSAAPTDDKIGLYFFPESTVAERVLDLLDVVIQKDLMFKFILDEVELLVFSSLILPKDHHRFLGNNYLWGAFRKRQVVSVSTFAANCWTKPSKLSEDIPSMGVSDRNTRNKEEAKGCNESSDVNRKLIEESECSGEREEEGEICDECVEREDGEIIDVEGHCLNLFPLQVEDMGLVSKAGGSDGELNLELGLSRRSSVATF